MNNENFENCEPSNFNKVFCAPPKKKKKKNQWFFFFNLPSHNFGPWQAQFWNKEQI